MKKKIIITGGLGYIGTELCKLYSGVSWHHKIIVIDNRFISERVNQLRNWNMEFIQGDILDKELIKKYTYLLFSIGTIFFIVNYFFSNLLVGIILGKEYYLSGELLKYFSIIFPLTALSNAFGRQWLMAMNKDNYYLAIITFCSTISLVSFLILSESLGLKAFHLSMIVYEFSTITIILFFVAKNENIQFF